MLTSLSLWETDDKLIDKEIYTKFGNEFKFFEHYGLSKFIGQETAKKLYDKKSIVIDNDDLPF